MSRDKRARKAALEQYARAHDRFSEAEQLAAGRGQHIEAEGHHRYALWVLRGFRAELDDPKPKREVSA